MGYVHKPIPFDILAKMPPHIRRDAIRQEREFLLKVRARQGQTAGFGYGILLGLVILLGVYLGLVL